MTDRLALLPALHRSTADLLPGLAAEQWTAADVAAPSLCEGWTRGHVLTHLARNADGIAATLAGALRGEIVERYPGGWDARNRAIDEGAGRPFAEILADVQTSAYRLERTLADFATPTPGTGQPPSTAAPPIGSGCASARSRSTASISPASTRRPTGRQS